jgi:hypothetical protein
MFSLSIHVLAFRCQALRVGGLRGEKESYIYRDETRGREDEGDESDEKERRREREES